MRSLRKFGSIISVAAFVSLPALAHASLEDARPSYDLTARAPDANLVLTFPIKVDMESSSVEVIDAQNRRVPIDKPQLSDNGTDINVPLRSPLQPGLYTLKWQAVSTDGRRSHGTYNFNVDP